jgi:hypothetical protein
MENPKEDVYNGFWIYRDGLWEKIMTVTIFSMNM